MCIKPVDGASLQHLVRKGSCHPSGCSLAPSLHPGAHPSTASALGEADLHAWRLRELASWQQSWWALDRCGVFLELLPHLLSRLAVTCMHPRCLSLTERKHRHWCACVVGGGHGPPTNRPGTGHAKQWSPGVSRSYVVLASMAGIATSSRPLVELLNFWSSGCAGRSARRAGEQAEPPWGWPRAADMLMCGSAPPGRFDWLRQRQRQSLLGRQPTSGQSRLARR